MEAGMIELILIGIMGFILIIAVVSTSDEARKIRKLLVEINQKLDHSGIAPNNPPAPSAFGSKPQNNNSFSGGSWNCKCGARVYNSDVCRNCGARRDQQ